MTDAGLFFFPVALVVIAGRPARIPQGIDGFARNPFPFVEGVPVDPRLAFGELLAAEYGIQKIHEDLDIARRGGVLAIAQIQPKLVRGAQMLIDLQHRPVCLLKPERTTLRLRKCRIHEQAARSHQRHQQVLVHRQFVLAAGEKPQPRMEPVRKRAGDLLEALVLEHVARVPPGIAFAGVPAGGDDGRDALVESGREQRLLAVPGMAADRDLAFVHLGQCRQVVDRAHARPRPSRQA